MFVCTFVTTHVCVPPQCMCTHTCARARAFAHLPPPHLHTYTYTYTCTPFPAHTQTPICRSGHAQVHALNIALIDHGALRQRLCLHHTVIMPLPACVLTAATTARRTCTPPTVHTCTCCTHCTTPRRTCTPSAFSHARHQPVHNTIPV